MKSKLWFQGELLRSVIPIIHLNPDSLSLSQSWSWAQSVCECFLSARLVPLETIQIINEQIHHMHDFSVRVCVCVFRFVCVYVGQICKKVFSWCSDSDQIMSAGLCDGLGLVCVCVHLPTQNRPVPSNKYPGLQMHLKLPSSLMHMPFRQMFLIKHSSVSETHTQYNQHLNRVHTGKSCTFSCIKRLTLFLTFSSSSVEKQNAI